MERVPLLEQGCAVGELLARELDGETHYRAVCTLAQEDVRSLWAVGSCGEIRLGVMEGGRFERCFSRRMTEPVGRLCRGELRPLTAPVREKGWKKTEDPAALVRTPWLKAALKNRRDVLFCTQRDHLFLALPYNEQKPFPLVPLFCFSRIQTIDALEYAVFSFDRNEWPVI